MDEARYDRAPDNPARTLLQKQSRLIDWQIAGERANLALKVLTGLAGLIVAVMLAAMAWEASQARGLVITAFSVPPDLAARGMTGDVVAARLQDRLTDMQLHVSSARAPQTLSNNWAGDIEVQIPQTGVSVGELRRALRAWLGQETRVSGSLAHTPTGLQAVVRVQGQPGDVVTGPDTAIDAVIDRLGERVFARTQTYRYATWLNQQGRREEARVAYERLARTGPSSERAWALVGLGNTESGTRQIRRALDIDPNLALAWQNLAGAELGLGQDEAAWRHFGEAIRSLDRDDHGGVSEAIATPARLLAIGGRQRLVGDFSGGVQTTRREEHETDYFDGHITAPLRRAELLARLHDVAGARAALQESPLAGPDDEGINRQLADYGNPVSPNALMAVAIEDWPTVVRQSRAVLQMMVADPAAWGQNSRGERLEPLLARALVRTGRAAEAAALIASTPLDCVPCLRARADVAERTGDRVAADRWFAEAVRQAPSIPFAYGEWGRARLARGDINGAISLFREAQARGPRWADPLKYEGDALTLLRDWSGALSRYTAAAERAPHWGALHLAWGRALAASGHQDEAHARWLAAAAMDLSAAGRAELNSLLTARP